MHCRVVRVFIPPIDAPVVLIWPSSLSPFPVVVSRVLGPSPRPFYCLVGRCAVMCQNPSLPRPFPVGKPLPDPFRLRVFSEPQSVICDCVLPFLYRLDGASVRFTFRVRQYLSSSHFRFRPLSLDLLLRGLPLLLWADPAELCFPRRPLRRCHRFWRSSPTHSVSLRVRSVSAPLGSTLLLCGDRSGAAPGALALRSTLRVISTMNSRSRSGSSGPFGLSRFVSWMESSWTDVSARRRAPPTMFSTPSPAISIVPWSVISMLCIVWHRTRPWRSARSVLSYGIRPSGRFASALVIHPRKRPLARTSPPYCSRASDAGWWSRSPGVRLRCTIRTGVLTRTAVGVRLGSFPARAPASTSCHRQGCVPSDRGVRRSAPRRCCAWHCGESRRCRVQRHRLARAIALARRPGRNCGSARPRESACVELHARDALDPLSAGRVSGYGRH